MSDIHFRRDDNLRVIAYQPAGGQIQSQSVEALLLLSILEKLEEIRCCTIDVEDAVKDKANEQ